MGCSVLGCTNHEFSTGHGDRKKRTGKCRKHHYNLPSRHLTSDPNIYVIDGPICRITCHKKDNSIAGYAIIDTEDMEKCIPYKWGITSDGYVVNGKNQIRLHHLIMNHIPDKNHPIDHKNRIKLDCRKENMELSTYSKNNVNRDLKNNTSGHKCVYWNKHAKSWDVRITRNKICTQLGYYKTLEKAIEVRDTFYIQLHKVLNLTETN
jgi:hypothetical protein